MGRKLNNTRGETLVEMLASILIAALSVAVLFTCCMASVEMGRETREADEKYYENLSAAEEQKTSLSGEVNVIVANEDAPTATQLVEINLYGGEEMYSYKKGADSGGP